MTSSTMGVPFLRQSTLSMLTRSKLHGVRLPAACFTKSATSRPGSRDGLGIKKQSSRRDVVIGLRSR
jgi:hypothetical protein